MLVCLVCQTNAMGWVILTTKSHLSQLWRLERPHSTCWLVWLLMELANAHLLSCVVECQTAAPPSQPHFTMTDFLVPDSVTAKGWVRLSMCTVQAITSLFFLIAILIVLQYGCHHVFGLFLHFAHSGYFSELCY